MAKVASKTRNSDGRKSGKAWKKSHNAPVKTLTPEQQERKAQKDAERERRRTVSHERGSNVTMPSFDWEWATETMQGRHIHTRRFRTVEACMREQRG